MSDSDAEFERFLQESLSGSSASYFSSSLADTRQRFLREEEETLERAAASSGWLKSSRQTSPGHTIELTLPTAGEGDSQYSVGSRSLNSDDVGSSSRRVGSGRRIRSANRRHSAEDPLNFSAGSGYSILNELEQHLAMTGSTQHGPGQETLEEEEAKRQFFAELEENNSSLNYSELNRQLGSTATSLLARDSLGHSGAADLQLQTIHEDNDSTPHYSEEEFETSDSSSHMLFPTIPGLPTDPLQHHSTDSFTTDPSYSTSSVTHRSPGLSPLRTPRPSLTSLVHPPPPSHNAPVTASLIELTEAPLNKQATPTPKPTVPTHKTTSLSHRLPSSSITEPQKAAAVHKQSTPTDTRKGHTSKRQSPKISPLHSTQDREKMTGDAAVVDIASSSHGEQTTANITSSLPLTTSKAMDKTTSQRAPPQSVELSDVLRALAVEELTSISRNLIRDQQQTDALPVITTTTVTSTAPPTVTHTITPSAPPTISSTAPPTTTITSTVPPTIHSPVTSFNTSLSSMNSSFSELQSSSPIPQPTTEYSGRVKDTATKPRGGRLTGRRGRGGGIQRKGDGGTGRSREGARQVDRKKVISEQGGEKKKQTITSATVSLETFSPQGSIVKLDSSKSASDVDATTEHRQFTSSGGGVMLALQQESHRWQTAWEEERERVRVLEEKLTQAERREGRARVAHSQQLTDLQHKLLTAKRQRSNDKEGESGGSESLRRDLDEQEKLINGYQKENERLYSELTRERQDMRELHKRMAVEKERHTSELAQARNTIEQLSDQLRGVRNTQGSGSGREENDEDFRLMQTECQQLQSQAEELTERVSTLQQQCEVAVEEGRVWRCEADSLRKNHSHEVAALREEARERREECQTAQQEISALRETENRLQQQIDKLQLSQRGGGRGSKPVAESRRVRELTTEIQQLKDALKRSEERIPRSTSGEKRGGHIVSDKSRDGAREKKAMESLLAAQVRRLEEEVASKESEYSQRMSVLQDKYHSMETLYEDHIWSLKEKLSTKHLRGGSVTPSSSRDTQLLELTAENQQLKKQLVQISSANEEKRTELQCKLMELERSHSQLQEEAEHKMAALQEQHNQAMGELVARYARHNLHTDVVRLQSRLEAKEAAIKLLQEQLAVATMDRNSLVAVREREEELGRQVKVLTDELLEAKRHHTPEMVHYTTLLTKIGQLETRLTDYCTRVRDPPQNGHHHHELKARDVEHRYTKQLQTKENQVLQYRQELDAIMATLAALQEIGEKD